jgi:hypothetical protein
MKRALGSWKSELIMSMLQLFCDKVRDRIKRETAVPLDLADKALANPRFLLLFCSAEFDSFIDRMKARRKDLAQVRRADLEDASWRVRCFGDYCSCCSVLAEPTAANPAFRAYVRGCFARPDPPEPDADDDGAAPDAAPRAGKR